MEFALTDVILVKLQRDLLLNPGSVETIKPLFGGRAKVLLKDGGELTASRQAAKNLRHVLGM